MSDQVDLSDLNFTPDWLKESGKTPEPREFRDDERPGRGKGGKGKGGRGGGQGRGKAGGGGRSGGGGFRDDDRRGGGGGGFKGKGKGGQRGGRDDRGGGGRGGFKGRGKGGGRGGDRDRRPPAPPKPPPGIVAEIHPGGPGVKQIAEQIKKTARAYSVFDIARAVVAGRERYSIHFKRDKPDAPELFTCKADSSAWLTRSEALAHLPSTPAFAEHYDEATVEGEAPTGNYTAIAVCGFSGKLIGPPNHHTYQTTIAKLHRDKFSNMSLDRYKQRIRIERDEETIEKWKAEQSVQKHYTYKKAAEGEDSPKFTARDAAERHFVENHADEYIASADEVAVSGNVPGRALSPGLLTALKGVAENARRHPASLVQPLCGMLGSEGLKFFKRGRKIFACLTRPKPLTDDSGLSAPIKAIVEHLRATKKATVETILEALAPGEAPAAKEEPKPEAAPEPAPAKTTKAHTLWIPRAPESEEAKPAKDEAPAAPTLTPAQIKVLQDLRWLLYEGAAIAFGDGHIELATPKPANEGQQQKQAKKKAPKKKIPIPGQPPKPKPLGAHTLWIPPSRPPKRTPKSEKPKKQPKPTPAPATKADEPKEQPKPAPASRAHTLWIK